MSLYFNKNQQRRHASVTSNTSKYLAVHMITIYWSVSHSKKSACAIMLITNSTYQANTAILALV